MKKKAEKIKQAEELKSQLATVSTVILSTFQGITVEQDTNLRREVEKAGGEVVGVSCIVDRLEGGAERLARYNFRPVFTIRDFGVEPPHG